MTGTVVSRSLFAVGANILLGGVFDILFLSKYLEGTANLESGAVFSSGPVIFVQCSLSVSHTGPSPVNNFISGSEFTR